MDSIRTGGEKTDFLRSSATTLLVALAALSPLIIVPLLSVPFQFTKAAFVVLLGLLALVAYLAGVLKNGRFALPRSVLLGAAWLVPLAYAFAGALSESPALSFFGRALEVDTVVFLAVMAALLSLGALAPRDGADVFRVLVALLGSAAVVGLFQVARVAVGSDALSLGILRDLAANIFGKWNDLGIFFGLVAILSFVALDRISLNLPARIAFGSLGALALVLVALVNFPLVWIVLGLFMLGFVVAGFSRSLFRRGAGEGKRALPLVAGALLALSVVFLLGGESMRRALTDSLGITYLEARPSLQSTLEVGKSVFAEHPAFGLGPNTFLLAWARFKPDGVNATPFWSADFGSGVGHVPTAFATAGLVGGGAWVVFLGVFLASGFRAFVAGGGRGAPLRFLAFASFLGALYLWIFTVIYVPNAVLVALAFLLSGLFVAAVRADGGISDVVVDFDANPRLGFVASLLMTVLMLAAVATLYVVGMRYAGAVLEQRSSLSLTLAGDADAAERDALSAARLTKSANAYRLAAEAAVAKMNAIVAENPTPSEETRALFQRTLSAGLEYAKEAARRGGEFPESWTTLARVYHAVVPLRIQGAYESAKLSYEEALARSPKSPGILLALARLELANGSPDAAREYLNRALSLKADYTEAVFLLAQIDVAAGRVESAIASVEGALVLAPQNPVLWFGLGYLKYTKRDASAVAALERAVALRDDYANAHYFLGLSYYRAGRTEDAIRALERVEELNPESADVKLILENLRSGRSPCAGAPSSFLPENRTALPVAD